jgi:hypothetical protein
MKPRTVKVLNTGVCGWCGEVLVQRRDEPYHNWRKRQTCNKQHAALLRERSDKEAIKLTPTIEARFHVKRYERGTHEFAVLAAQYARR